MGLLPAKILYSVKREVIVFLEAKELITLASAIAGTGLLFLYSRQLGEVLGEALRNFRGGGPRPPSHPLPGNDGFIVRRKRRRVS